MSIPLFSFGAIIIAAVNGVGGVVVVITVFSIDTVPTVVAATVPVFALHRNFQSDKHSAHTDSVMIFLLRGLYFKLFAATRSREKKREENRAQFFFTTTRKKYN